LNRPFPRTIAEQTSTRDNLQYSVVSICLLVLGAVLSLALGRFAVPPHIAKRLIFISFLILFEFLLVVADPYIENCSGVAPGMKLLFNAVIAPLIFPAHGFFESKMKERLVKKQVRFWCAIMRPNASSYAVATEDAPFCSILFRFA